MVPHNWISPGPSHQLNPVLGILKDSSVLDNRAMLLPEMSQNHSLTKFVLNGEDDILSAFVLQLPRCIVHLHYFCCVANRLICC